MRRRDFMAGITGALALPLAARAQQKERIGRVGLLTGYRDNDRAGQIVAATIREGLANLGWVEGRNLRMDIRFAGLDPERFNWYAAELVSFNPDVIIVSFNAAQRAVQARTRTIPIVIAGTGDVVANGTVKNIAHPEGNITGIANLFASIGSKWLEVLKDIAPEVKRVGLILTEVGVRPNPYVLPIEEVAPRLGIATIPIPYHDGLELVRAIDAFAAEPQGGLIVIPPIPNREDRRTILQRAMRYNLPTVWQARFYVVAEGGLISYGSKPIDLFRRVPFYVDRILHGAKVSELPIEYPAKFELVVNLKTARSIGLTVPETVLVRADEVIE
jgi:putative tryptophan/tyrosine transport system substrate-binding protein